MTPDDHCPRFPMTLLRFWARRILPWWLLVAAVIFFMQIAVCGIIHDDENVKNFLAFLEMLPAIVRANLGGDAVMAGSLPALIAIGYNHPLVQTLYMVFAVAAPTGMLAGEVQSGTMELILSRHVTRTQTYICAAAVTVTGMLALVVVMFLGTVAATAIYQFPEPVPLYRFFQVAVNGAFLASAVAAISLLVAAAFHRRVTAVGISVAYLIVNHFVTTTSTSWKWMQPFEPYSIFHYINGRKVFAEQAWPLTEIAVLAAVITIALTAGWLIWQKKDLRL